ncbi:unnamed protein product [Linum tenue]|uniref:Uncharacterized protein n=1 Tax=Linum tenue TaxID=586396 RepID=A0AAV0MCZ8_9ROSI|nr:unnamed protein product [Linum tenue]
MVAHKLLADLNDRDGPHTLLKLRLLNAWGSYSIKNPEHIFSYCTLWNDEEGTLVQGSAVPTLISHFREILRLGSVYFVSGVKVQPPGSTYRCCSHKLSIVLSQETVFKEVAESDPPFWQDAFEFVPFSSLQSRIGSSVYLTDIVGYVVSVGGISHSVNNFGDTVRRDVVLQNESHMKVTVALWGPQTLCVDHERIMELSTAGAVLLGFCSLKVSGTSSGDLALYSTPATRCVYEPISEMTELIRSVKGKGVKQYVSFSAGETSSAPSKQDRSLSASLSKSISHVSDISDEDDQIHLRRTNVQNRLSSSVIDESLLPVEPVYLPEEHVIRRRRRLVLAGHAIGQSFLAEPDICCAFSDDVSASLSDDTFVPPTEHDATLVSEILLEVSKSKSKYCDPKLKHGNDVSVIDVEKDTVLLSEIVVPTSVASKSKKRRSCSKNPKDDVLQSHPAMPSEDVCPALKAKHRHSRTKGASRTGKFSSYKKLLNLTAPVKEPVVDENIQTKIASEDVTLLFEVVAPTSAYLKSKKRGSRSKNVQANPVMASEGVCPVLKTKHQRSQTKNAFRSGKLSSQDKLLSLATPIKEPSVAKSVQTEIAFEDAVFMEGDDALEGQPAMVSKVVALTSEPKVRRIRSKNTTRNEKSGWSAKAIHVEKNTVLDDIAHVQGEGITISEKNLAVGRSKRNRTPSRKALEAVASQSMPSMGRASSQKRKQPIK